MEESVEQGPFLEQNVVVKNLIIFLFFMVVLNSTGQDLFWGLKGFLLKIIIMGV